MVPNRRDAVARKGDERHRYTFSHLLSTPPMQDLPSTPPSHTSRSHLDRHHPILAGLGDQHPEEQRNDACIAYLTRKKGWGARRDDEWGMVLGGMTSGGYPRDLYYNLPYSACTRNAHPHPHPHPHLPPELIKCSDLAQGLRRILLDMPARINKRNISRGTEAPRGSVAALLYSIHTPFTPSSHLIFCPRTSRGT